MRKSRIKAKLRANQPALVTTLHFTDPQAFELTSLMGFDGIWIDLEHHPTSVETAACLMRAARVGCADIVARPAKGEFMRMGRLLEIGAQAIMYPRCDDAREAAEVVKWSKFAPLGQRGLDTGNPDAPYCMMPLAPYVRAANEETLLVIQLESASAVDQADSIAQIEGVDVLMLGPGDYSLLEGFPGRMDDRRIFEAQEKIAAAARRHGKHWGRPSFSVEQTKELLEMGARFICHGADLLFVKNALEKIRRDFAPLGFTFDDRFERRLSEIGVEKDG